MHAREYNICVHNSMAYYCQDLETNQTPIINVQIKNCGISSVWTVWTVQLWQNCLLLQYNLDGWEGVVWWKLEEEQKLGDHKKRGNGLWK